MNEFARWELLWVVAWICCSLINWLFLMKLKLDQYYDNINYIYRQNFQINVTISANMNINCYMI